MKIKIRGFTLIELLVVIGIITTLAVLSLSMTGSSRRQARDVKRKSDLKQYQTSLENFATNNSSLYPGRSSTVSAKTILCSDLNLSSCPEDPRGVENFGYNYQSNGSNDGLATATTYVLWAKLENVENFQVFCSNGNSGLLETVNIAGGVCPL